MRVETKYFVYRMDDQGKKKTIAMTNSSKMAEAITRQKNIVSLGLKTGEDFFVKEKQIPLYDNGFKKVK